MKNIKNIRFSYDNHHDYKEYLFEARNNPEERMKLLSSSLKIDSLITPSLYKIKLDIEKKLGLENIKTEYYVSNSLEMNASCFSLNNNKDLIVILNSGLVNKFSLEELSFIIGHEIGHYLLGHLKYAKKNDERNLIKLNHAMEISADRIGLICVNDVEIAIKAMVKLISGLDDKFISNNMSQLIKQHNQLEELDTNIYSYTHPSIPTRTKALKLFSMSTPYYKWIDCMEKPPINKVKLNKTVEKYLDNTSLKFMIDKNNKIMEMMKIWVLTAIFMEDDILEEEEICILKKEVGEETTLKIIGFIESRNKDSVYKKLFEVKRDFNRLSIDIKRDFLNMIKDIFKLYKGRYSSDRIINKIFKN